jgi:hypothetical protein
MTKPVKIALWAALPIELVNLCVGVGDFKGPSIDSSLLERFLYRESAFIHWPAKIIPPWAPMSHIALSITLTIVKVAVFGYVDTVILILAAYYGVRFLVRACSGRA